MKDVAGKAQRKLGEAIGGTEQQLKGVATRFEGKLRKAVGDVRATLKEASPSEG